MNIAKILEEDLDYILSYKIDYEKLRGKTIYLTGVTGLVGSFVAKSIAWMNYRKGLGIKIIALVRDSKKAQNILEDFSNYLQIKYIEGDIRDKVCLEENVDYIIHCASITNSKQMIEKPVDTIVTSVNGTENVLTLAVEKKVASMVYVSSMEMYGTVDDEDVTEDKLGYINLDKVRSGYPESKRLCELLCKSYAEQYDLQVCSARLAQTFGPGILKTESRVFAQFAKSCINSEDIVLHTKGLSEGNYCYLAETIIGLFIILLNGEKGESYNVCNEACHTTIADMAEMVAHEIGHDKIKVKYDIPKNTEKYGYAADVKLKLSGVKLKKIGFVPKIGLKEAYERMIDYMCAQEV